MLFTRGYMTILPVIHILKKKKIQPRAKCKLIYLANVSKQAKKKY